MIKSKFSIQINAPKEKVWETLWNDETYRKWTAFFSEGSYAKSDWQEGSKIQFLTPDGSGMFSRIHKKIPNTQMTFQHLGEIKNGEEVPSAWVGGFESYFLEEKNGVTELTVEADTTEEYQQFFTDTFPKALQVVKQLSEN